MKKKTILISLGILLICVGAFFAQEIPYGKIDTITYVSNTV